MRLLCEGGFERGDVLIDIRQALDPVALTHGGAAVGDVRAVDALGALCHVGPDVAGFSVVLE